MSKKYKKIIGVSMAVALLGSAFTLVGCKDDGYKGEKLTPGYVADAQVSSNGGFVVEKGDYVYFINGAQDYTANNEYGNVVKGSLMRIAKSDMKAGNYDKAQIVVPSLFASGNYDSGIYIYGDYVYYATPTTDTTVKGESKNSQMDFKKARLDGSSAPSKDPFLRLDSNTAKYRFVTEKGVDRNKDGKDDVFCLYEENSELKSFNVDTKEKVTLVKGAGAFFYDQNDLANPNVYYTMSVVYDADSENPTTGIEYNQIYCVNASARVAKTDASTASYTVENGKTYDFDEKFMKDKAEKNGYDLKDYKTYPYVNLGSLVLDGIGFSSGKYTQFNGGTAEDQAQASEPRGYTYTITNFASNGEEKGVYFTRKNVTTTPSEASDKKLYYVSESQIKAEGWNEILGNKSVDTVAEEYGDGMNASSKALFSVKDNGNGTRTHSYFYTKTEGEKTHLYKVATNKDGEEGTSVKMVDGVDSGITLWKVCDNYLYYYGTGTNGNNLSRVDYTGECDPENGKDDYHVDKGEEKFKSVNFTLVDWYDTWYKPEFVSVDADTEFLMYANVQSYGTDSVAHNYIYATETSKSNTELLSIQKEYEKYEDLLAHEDYKDETDAQNLIKYFFFGGEEIPEEYQEKYEEKTWVDEIKAKFVASEGASAEVKKADSYIHQIGRITAKDAKKMEEGLKGWLIALDEEKTDDKDGLPGYAIGLIIAGSVLLVGAGVAIPLVIVLKKKKAKKLEMEATVNAYKRKKIDTTDDKSIDVYADESGETPVEETAEETVEETVAEVVAEDNQTQE